jgi:hypothetical protein
MGGRNSVAAAVDDPILVPSLCCEVCAGRPEPPILKFDANGRLLSGFDNGMFTFPHGSDRRKGNLWVTDAGGRDCIGRREIKFSLDGVELIRPGRPGCRARAGSTNDLVVAPNGDIRFSRLPTLRTKN